MHDQVEPFAPQSWVRLDADDEDQVAESAARR
jgi:hypothetical protein